MRKPSPARGFDLVVDDLDLKHHPETAWNAAAAKDPYQDNDNNGKY